MNRITTEELVISVISRYLLSQNADCPVNQSTSLFGAEAILDSMGLVNIVIDLESEFLDRGIEISLTSENAMSRRQSPFRTIETLVDYICEQIDE